ncbi:MAG TPA: ABC transporter permease [Phycisphaerales bacterium]|nr:ABC transporter permease [Phycisphaerales bacterium]
MSENRPRHRRIRPGIIGLGFLLAMFLTCIATLPWTLGTVRSPGGGASSRIDLQLRTARHLPPSWWGFGAHERSSDPASKRLEATARLRALEHLAATRGTTVERLEAEHVEPSPADIAAARPFYLFGTDLLGRDLFVRCLAGGGISLTIGIAAAALAVLLGTLYGAISGYAGGRTDAVMMRIVDVLYGLPYVLLVVLLAVAADGVMGEYVSREKARMRWVRQEVVSSVHHAAIDPSMPLDAAEVLKAHPDLREKLEREAEARFPPRIVSNAGRTAFDLTTLLVAIGGVSWLTMARVIRGQVLSLKAQPFIEAARAMGVGTPGIFVRHLLPNLVGPIVVYATLTVPQAILQESFLSFLGIGVRPPMPSWGNLAAEGLGEINPVSPELSHWWLLLFPCLLLGATLVALNFAGESLRERMDPKSRRC